MKIIKISQTGIDLIKGFESFYAKPYLCPAKVPTIGYGTTRYPNGSKVTLNDRTITEAEAVSFMQHDLKQFELDVDAMAIDTLNQNQFDALVSFAYNLGSQALRGSTLLKKVNVNTNDPNISIEFSKWCYTEKEKLPGLIRRRQKECNLYFK